MRVQGDETPAGEWGVGRTGMNENQELRAGGRRGMGKLLSSGLIIFTLAIGILIGTVVSDGVGAADENKALAAPDATPLVVPSAEPLENQFADIVATVRAAVVNIQVETYARKAAAGGGKSPAKPGEGGGGDDGMEDFFRRFFGMPNGPEGLNSPQPRRPGEGSGFIVDGKGYIITNKHVVEDADRIQVRFDGEDQTLDAKLIGFDDETDLAVIKVEPDRKLAVVGMGNSDAVRVGDWALAIGSPFGFRETVTLGIISAKGREVQSAAARFNRPFQKFFQTDAAINPGNSGGPLVNTRGQVIGINTAIVSRSGAYEGLGFALPANIAVEVYNQIIRYGRVARGSIGITFLNNQDPALLRTYGAEDGGVFVGSVKEGGPADVAGIEEEDVIVSIDGQAIEDGEQLIAIVAATPVDETVPVVIVRAGKKTTVQVKIADRAELFATELGLADPHKEEEVQEAKVDLGIGVTNMTPKSREQLEYEGDTGLLINDVAPGSFAEDLGLLVNDIIVAVNREPVESVEDLRDLRNELEPGDDVAFKVMRSIGGSWRAQYFAGVLPDKGSDRF